MMTPLRWLVVVLATVVAVLVGLEMVRKSVIINREKAARAGAEARLAETVDALTAEQRSRRDLEQQADVLRGEIDSLATQLGHKPKIVEVVKWKTKEVVIETSRTGEVICPPGYTQVEMDGKPYCAPSDGGAAIPPCPDCPDVLLRVEGAEARLESKAGNLFAVGQVSLVQTQPVNRIYTVPFESGELSIPAPTPTRVRWMLGGGAQLTNDGMQYGVAAATPQMRLGRVAARGMVTATTDGTDGAVGGWVLLGWAR